MEEGGGGGGDDTAEHGGGCEAAFAEDGGGEEKNAEEEDGGEELGGGLAAEGPEERHEEFGALGVIRFGDEGDRRECPGFDIPAGAGEVHFEGVVGDVGGEDPEGAEGGEAEGEEVGQGDGGVADVLHFGPAGAEELDVGEEGADIERGDEEQHGEGPTD